MTIDIDAIRQREQAAEPGPWIAETNDRGHAWVNLPAYNHAWGMHGFTSEAEFVAHARTDVPALLAELDRVRAAAAKVAGDLESTAAEARDAGLRDDAEHAETLARKVRRDILGAGVTP